MTLLFFHNSICLFIYIYKKKLKCILALTLPFLFLNVVAIVTEWVRE
jgi:hypothetical protein